MIGQGSEITSALLTATGTPMDSSKASCSAQLRSTGCHSVVSSALSKEKAEQISTDSR